MHLRRVYLREYSSDMRILLSEQLFCILYSLITGVFLGLIYDVLRCIRTTVFTRKYVTVICDVLFMLIFTFATLIISMGFTRGLARYYIVAAEFAGYVLFRYTIGKFAVRLFILVFIKIRNIIKIVTEFASKKVKKLLQRQRNI